MLKENFSNRMVSCVCRKQVTRVCEHWVQFPTGQETRTIPYFHLLSTPQSLLPVCLKLRWKEEEREKRWDRRILIQYVDQVVRQSQWRKVKLVPEKCRGAGIGKSWPWAGHTQTYARVWTWGSPALHLPPVSYGIYWEIQTSHNFFCLCSWCGWGWTSSSLSSITRFMTMSLNIITLENFLGQHWLWPGHLQPAWISTACWSCCQCVGISSPSSGVPVRVAQPEFEDNWTGTLLSIRW